MPHTYTNGVVTFYEDAGDGPVVVLIHGHSLDLRMWQYQVTALVDAGFRVVRHDVRGHGRSLIAPSGYTWENYSADLRDLLDRLNVERPITETLHVPAAHLVGLSMGGGVALQFALDSPQRVISLTLVDSALPGYAYSEEMSEDIQELVHAVRAEGARAAFERLWLSHALFDGVRRFPDRFGLVREIVLGFQAPQYREGLQTPDFLPPAIADRLGEIVAPALVAVGENDLPDFQMIADILAENLPNAHKRVFAGCHHLPPLEDPEAFNTALLDFLRASTGRGVRAI